MSDLTAFGPHDPICPAPHASDVCMCPWITKARADEREKVNVSWQVDFDNEMADLRAKVEALVEYGCPEWSVEVDDDLGRHVRKDQVLDLIDGAPGNE